MRTSILAACCGVAVVVLGVVWWSSRATPPRGESAEPVAATPDERVPVELAIDAPAPIALDREAAVAPENPTSFSVVSDVPHEAGSVRVRAVWASRGTPAVGVALRLTHRDAPTPPAVFFDAHTQADGSAVFPKVALGAFEVASDRGITLTGHVERERELALELRLEDGLRVHGRTIDAAGRSVAHAELYLLRGGSRAPFAIGESDNRGVFEIAGLAREMQVFARARDHSPSLPRVVGSTSEEWDIALGERGANLVGQVVDANERPVVGAAVCVETIERADEPWALVATDGEGRFAFNGLAPGRKRLMARTARHAPYVEVIELGLTTRDERIVRIAEGGWVAGKLYFEGGASAADIEIVLKGDSEFVQVTTRSAADGAFGLRGVPHGKTNFSIGGVPMSVDVAPIGATSWNPILSRDR